MSSFIFSPIDSLSGGALLFLSSSYFLHLNGKILGISGILEEAFHGIGQSRLLALAVLAGMASGGILAKFFITPISASASLITQDNFSTLGWILAGILVGFGTRLGSGCTSGHMLCGISRFSPRSMVATLVFVTMAIFTTITFQTSPRNHVTYLPLTFSALKSSAYIVIYSIASFEVLRQLSLRPHSKHFYKEALRVLTALNTGFWFAIGLSLSGMLDRSKILAFLDIATLWNLPYTAFDPSLLMVFLTGVIPNVIAYNFYIKNTKPLLDDKLNIPTSTLIDWKLLLGAAFFGVGWGGWGVCPGPAFVNLWTGNGLAFAGGYIAGMEGARVVKAL